MENTIKVNLGDENNAKLKQLLEAVLAKKNILLIDHDWVLAGSQEIETWRYQSRLGLVVVEAETYIGLCITGPACLIQEITETVNSDG